MGQDNQRNYTDKKSNYPNLRIRIPPENRIKNL
ncbi:hypothetical protein OOU_Y34scaffold00371g1 [Pyricularia oryzae Y34]|uniref:Uncharacterized protein n=1 Tax=Pyricularia oryzae (strain Y34) TaxID=1143189 RepID=A0AA97P2F7_PYRO3|nr:hypothetical protein OOU_Y34scaffold00371g1 [Pyricularia oryzae Y34]